jgi:hypothetical protein
LSDKRDLMARVDQIVVDPVRGARVSPGRKMIECRRNERGDRSIAEVDESLVFRIAI